MTRCRSIIEARIPDEPSITGAVVLIQCEKETGHKGLCRNDERITWPGPTIRTDNDPVHHPAHYDGDRFGCECIAVTRGMLFSPGNAYKYVWRHREKRGVEDLRKALVYLQWAEEDRILPNISAISQHYHAWHVHPRLGRLPRVYQALNDIVTGDYMGAHVRIERAIEGES